MKLYKKDSKGKIRELEIKALGDMLYQISGLVEGKKVTHEKQCKIKNIGKSNETTPQEQAKIEATALIVKKIREGYFYSIEEAMSNNVIMPMLAKEYFKERKKLEKLEKIAVQPKLDGVRCIIHYNATNKTIKALSRKNKQFEYIGPILDDIKEALADYKENVILDGELYLHGKTFQEVTKLTKNSWGELGETPEYWIYDIVDDKMSFIDRSNLILSLYDALELSKSAHIVIVDTAFIKNTEEEIKYHFKSCIADGYEGMMVRVPESVYKIKGRSSDLLKYKEFETVTLPIADITPNDAKPTHGTVWTIFEGNLQKTGAKLSHADREDLLTNKDKYIGRMGEFRYFEKTDAGLMRFPVFLGLREDK